MAERCNDHCVLVEEVQGGEAVRPDVHALAVDHAYRLGAVAPRDLRMGTVAVPDEWPLKEEKLVFEWSELFQVVN